MSRRVGILVYGATIRVAVTQRGRMVATAMRDLEESVGIAPQVASLFQTLGALSNRASVRVAFDRPIAQLKVVVDAPPNADRRLLEKALLENADRYFIGGESSHYFAVRAYDGGAAIVAYDRRAIDEVARAAFEAGAADLVAVSVASLPAPQDAENPAFAAAHSVALIDERTMPAVRIRASNDPRRVRISSAIAAAIVALGLLAAPVFRARKQAAGARAELAAIGGHSSDVMKARNDRAALRAIIDRARPTGLVMTDLLAAFTNALPVRASLIALTVDSLKGSAVILAADAVEALPSLDSIETIDQVRLSGPVTRERLANRDFERATILFLVRTP